MNYDSESQQFAGRTIDRFPTGVNGVSLWQTAARTLPLNVPQIGRPTRFNATPCVFVSYKSQDRQLALRLAYLCNQEGFEYWMDVLDPNLSGINPQPNSQQKSVLVATIIEMALLNSSHVIATITNQTASSQWVPYEFGRVKDQAVVATEACSWVHPIQNPTLAEYLFLCPQYKNEAAIINWLTSERTKWEAQHGVKLPRPASTWPHPVPARLP